MSNKKKLKRLLFNNDKTTGRAKTKNQPISTKEYQKTTNVSRKVTSKGAPTTETD
jgi:hypothetical protein